MVLIKFELKMKVSKKEKLRIAFFTSTIKWLCHEVCFYNYFFHEANTPSLNNLRFREDIRVQKLLTPAA